MTSFSLWKLSNQRRYCDPDPTIIYKYTYMGYIMISSSMACVERRLSWNECNKYHWNIKSSSYLRDSFSAHNLSTSLNGPYIFFLAFGNKNVNGNLALPSKTHLPNPYIYHSYHGFLQQLLSKKISVCWHLEENWWYQSLQSSNLNLFFQFSLF